jgi:hypothetical protein
MDAWFLWHCLHVFNAADLEELKQSDLPDLVDMLSQQATEYSRLTKTEGITSKTIAIKEFILNIQTAIDAKKSSEKKSVIR